MSSTWWQCANVQTKSITHNINYNETEFNWREFLSKRQECFTIIWIKSKTVWTKKSILNLQCSCVSKTNEEFLWSFSTRLHIVSFHSRTICQLGEEKKKNTLLDWIRNIKWMQMNETPTWAWNGIFWTKRTGLWVKITKQCFFKNTRMFLIFFLFMFIFDILHWQVVNFTWIKEEIWICKLNLQT